VTRPEELYHNNLGTHEKFDRRFKMQTSRSNGSNSRYVFIGFHTNSRFLSMRTFAVALHLAIPEKLYDSMPFQAGLMISGLFHQLLHHHHYRGLAFRPTRRTFPLTKPRSAEEVLVLLQLRSRSKYGWTAPAFATPWPTQTSRAGYRYGSRRVQTANILTRPRP